MFDKLKPHLGHRVAISYYGSHDNPDDICIECTDCCEVLVSAQTFAECEEREANRYSYGAQDLYMLYMTLKNSGFTRDQAFELTNSYIRQSTF